MLIESKNEIRNNAKIIIIDVIINNEKYSNRRIQLNCDN